MGKWFKFWLGCLSWAFTRWEKGEPVMTPLFLTIIATVFTLVGLGGVYQAILEKNLLWLIALIPLGFLVVFIAPYKLWMEKQNRLTQLDKELQPKLEVSIESCIAVPGGSPFPGQKQSYFWRLKVENNSLTPIPKCFAIIINCYRISENGSKTIPEGTWPREGFHLPWGRMSGEKNYEIGLAGEQPAFLDYIMIHNESAGILHIPSRPDNPDDRPNYTAYPIAHDNLEFTIAVWSKAIRMKRSVIRFQFEWHGGKKATITVLESTNPQVLDKEGSQT